MHRATRAHSQTLSSGVSSFPGARVLVIGDIMLDRYIKGDVHRVSPEAPVPVVDMTNTTRALGGAANVSANIASLGGDPCMIGLVGDDAEAAELKQTLAAQGIDCGSLVTDPSRPTTTKTRIVVGHQQICRIDQERRKPADAEREEALIREAERNVEGCSVCVVSDYDKGCLTHRVTQRVIAAARRLGKPIVVDPKSRDFRKYAGCTVITPNTREAEAASGEVIGDRRDLLRAARKLAEAIPESALLITQGANGMSLFRDGAAPVHMRAQARRVFDVTGAGDTVVSALSLALAVEMSLEMAALLANTAAGLVVQKPGTAQITLHELLANLSQERRKSGALMESVQWSSMRGAAATPVS